MKAIIEILETKLSKDKYKDCSVLTYLLWKLINTGNSGEKDAKLLLNKLDKETLVDLTKYILKAGFYNTPIIKNVEKVGVNEYIKYLMQATNEEIEVIIR